MYFATKLHKTQILIWLIWAIACLAFLAAPESGLRVDEPFTDRPMLAAVVTDEPQRQYLFPWQPKRRFRKWAWRRYRDWRRARRRAMWVARLAWLASTGALTLAQLVDLVTRSQLRRHLGALPVLYALLETLQVRQIINRHCPTLAEVDHGTVALVLILIYRTRWDRHQHLTDALLLVQRRDDYRSKQFVRLPSPDKPVYDVLVSGSRLASSAKMPSALTTRTMARQTQVSD